MRFIVSRTQDVNPTHNTLVLRRPRMAHISAVLKSNSGAVSLPNISYRLFLANGEQRQGASDGSGLVREVNVPPGDHTMELAGLEGRFLIPATPVHICRRPIRVPGYFLASREAEGADGEAETAEEEETEAADSAEEEDWDEDNWDDDQDPDSGS